MKRVTSMIPVLKYVSIIHLIDLWTLLGFQKYMELCFYCFIIFGIAVLLLENKR